MNIMLYYKNILAFLVLSFFILSQTATAQEQQNNGPQITVHVTDEMKSLNAAYTEAIKSLNEEQIALLETIEKEHVKTYEPDFETFTLAAYFDICGQLHSKYGLEATDLINYRDEKNRYQKGLWMDFDTKYISKVDFMDSQTLKKHLTFEQMLANQLFVGIMKISHKNMEPELACQKATEMIKEFKVKHINDAQIKINAPENGKSQIEVELPEKYRKLNIPYEQAIKNLSPEQIAILKNIDKEYIKTYKPDFEIVRLGIYFEKCDPHFEKYNLKPEYFIQYRDAKNAYQEELWRRFDAKYTSTVNFMHKQALKNHLAYEQMRALLHFSGIQKLEQQKLSTEAACQKAAHIIREFKTQ